MPASACLATTHCRATLPAASSSSVDTTSPRDRRAYRRVSSEGRGRLPVCVVRTRLLLVRIVPPRGLRLVNEQAYPYPYHGSSDEAVKAEGGEISLWRHQSASALRSDEHYRFA